MRGAWPREVALWGAGIHVKSTAARSRAVGSRNSCVEHGCDKSCCWEPEFMCGAQPQRISYAFLQG